MSVRARVRTVGRWLCALGIGGVAAGIMFWLALVHTVHRGTVAVPSLMGMEVEKARRTAHDRGLVLHVDPEGVFNPDVASKLVGAQEPVPGFHLKSGAVVTVRQSLGRRRAEVPQVSGVSLQAAARDLEAEGLRVGRQVEVGGEAAGEVVLTTQPPEGSMVGPDEEISVLLNVRPQRRTWVMPAFISHSEATVRRFCRRHAIRIGQVHQVAYQGMAPGVVLRQYPAAGSPLSRSDIVSLWVSR